MGGGERRSRKEGCDETERLEGEFSGLHLQSYIIVALKKKKKILQLLPMSGAFSPK